LDAFVSKVTSRGQVTLPQKLRDEEGITGDDYVVMRRIGRYIVLGKAELGLDEITAEFSKQAGKSGLMRKALLSELNLVRSKAKG